MYDSTVPDSTQPDSTLPDSIMPETILSARGVVQRFALRDGLRSHWLKALRGVDLDVRSGECLALVGESGCGKTTLGKCLVGHLRPAEGRVEHRGVDLASLRGVAWRERRRKLQMVFQDSAQAFDPRLRILDSMMEAMSSEQRSDGAAAREQAAELLASVDLDAGLLDRLPHQLSGGQRQRLGIARALAANAEVLVLDEPVSALDVSVRGQVLDLLRELRRQRNVTLVFIGHDLGVVRSIADRVAVLYLGHVVELGPAQEVLRRPSHPYTAALLDAVPRLGAISERRRLLPGDVPSAVDPPSGCPFHPRCARAEDRCRIERPMLRSSPRNVPDARAVTAEHQAACHVPLRHD